MRRISIGITASLVAACVFACTGDDPDLTFTSGSDAGVDAPIDGEATDGRIPAPKLVLEAEPLTLTVGGNDVLRVKVVERQDIGELTFRVQGLPEGVTAPATATLAPTADAITFPLTAAALARHGDFDLTVQADGQPYEAKAHLVLRGAPGTLDTGFGLDGKMSLKFDPNPDLKVVGLTDGRILLGRSGSKPVIRIVDAKGSPNGTPVTVSQDGTLQDMAATAGGGFVLAVTHTDGAHLLWFSAAGIETKNVVVGTQTPPPKIASTPLGVLFAQTTPTTSLTIKRFLDTGVADPAFSTVIFEASDPSLYAVAGTAAGAAWASLQTDYQQVAIVKTEPGKATFDHPFLPQESCATIAALGEEIVARCGRDSQEPRVSIRRYRPNQNALDTGFGVGGYYALPLNNFDRLRAFGTDRVYFSEWTTSTAIRVTALDGQGRLRAIFGTNGALDVTGPQARPFFAVDARGRLLFVAEEYIDQLGVVVSRYWD